MYVCVCVCVCGCVWVAGWLGVGVYKLLTSVSRDEVERVYVGEVISAVYVDSLQQSHNHP